MTNFEKIKQLNVEEFARLMTGKADCRMCLRARTKMCTSKIGNCDTGVADWLQLEEDHLYSENVIDFCKQK